MQLNLITGPIFNTTNGWTIKNSGSSQIKRRVIFLQDQGEGFSPEENSTEPAHFFFGAQCSRDDATTMTAVEQKALNMSLKSQFYQFTKHLFVDQFVNNVVRSAQLEKRVTERGAYERPSQTRQPFVLASNVVAPSVQDDLDGAIEEQHLSFNEQSVHLPKLKQNAKAPAVKHGKLPDKIVMSDNAARKKNAQSKAMAAQKNRFKSNVYGGLHSIPPESYRERFVKKLGRKKVEQIYICHVDDCNYECTKSTSIVVHIRKHYGVAPYQCNTCDRLFTQSGSLKRHLDTVHASAD